MCHFLAHPVFADSDAATVGPNEWQRRVDVMAVADEDTPRLRASTFAQVVISRLGGTALFNCQYDNAVQTEWYRQQSRIIHNHK